MVALSKRKAVEKHIPRVQSWGLKRQFSMVLLHFTPKQRTIRYFATHNNSDTRRNLLTQMVAESFA